MPIDGRGNPWLLGGYQFQQHRFVAHWEGNTLVVHTIAIKDLAYLDANQGPHRDALEVEERIHLTKLGTMQIDYYCNENPRNPAREDGSLGFTFKMTTE